MLAGIWLIKNRMIQEIIVGSLISNKLYEFFFKEEFLMFVFKELEIKKKQ